MNKTAYLILLAITAQQSSMLASWSWKSKSPSQQEQSTSKPAAPVANTPLIFVSDALSENAEYREKLAQHLRAALAQAKRGSVDVKDLETVIITEHAPAIIKPGNDALKELENKNEHEAAELRNKNESLEAAQKTHTRKQYAALAVALIAGCVIGRASK